MLCVTNNGHCCKAETIKIVSDPALILVGQKLAHGQFQLIISVAAATHQCANTHLEWYIWKKVSLNAVISDVQNSQAHCNEKEGLLNMRTKFNVLHSMRLLVCIVVTHTNLKRFKTQLPWKLVNRWTMNNCVISQNALCTCTHNWFVALVVKSVH